MSTRQFMTPIKIGNILATTFHEAAFALRKHGIDAADYAAWRLGRSIRDDQVRADEHLEQRLRNWPGNHPGRDAFTRAAKRANLHDDVVFE